MCRQVSQQQTATERLLGSRGQGRLSGGWPSGSCRKGSEEAERLMVFQGLQQTRRGSETDGRVEGKMGAHEVRGGCLAKSLECQAKGGGFGPVGNGKNREGNGVSGRLRRKC